MGWFPMNSLGGIGSQKVLNPKVTIFRLAILVLSSSCASGTLFDQLADIPEGQGAIYVLRPSAYVGAACESHVYLDDKKIAELWSGNYELLLLQPATYVVSFTEPCGFKKRGAVVSLEAGSNHFLTYDMAMDGIQFIPGITVVGYTHQDVHEVPKTEALEMLRKLKKRSKKNEDSRRTDHTKFPFK